MLVLNSSVWHDWYLDSSPSQDFKCCNSISLTLTHWSCDVHGTMNSHDIYSSSVFIWVNWFPHEFLFWQPVSVDIDTESKSNQIIALFTEHCLVFLQEQWDRRRDEKATCVLLRDVSLVLYGEAACQTRLEWLTGLWAASSPPCLKTCPFTWWGLFFNFIFCAVLNSTLFNRPVRSHGQIAGIIHKCKNTVVHS